MSNRSLNIKLHKLASAIGIKRSQHNYVKFILLGRSRTGSNFVRGLLNSHPQIITFGEVFVSNQEIKWGFDDYTSAPGAFELFQQDPPAFLQQMLFCDYPRGIAAVGFKLFYYHARENELEVVWRHLQAQKDIRILHIKRRNMLRTHLSHARAVHTDQWANVSGEHEAEPPIALDFDECLKDFEQTSQWEVEYDQFFAAHPRYDVFYEELVNDFDRQVIQIQDFLEVKHAPLESDTYKQSHKPLSRSIVNYAELKEKFSGTQWEKFFNDFE
ncbi:MAG: sulfotransferase [Anaerolineae bacterium]|nr:sulfotransferase [Anaerolineae bacterium]MCZ7551919.1 sulfotransferase [Anaerolineales bacterium]